MSKGFLLLRFWPLSLFFCFSCTTYKGTNRNLSSLPEMRQGELGQSDRLDHYMSTHNTCNLFYPGDIAYDHIEFASRQKDSPTQPGLEIPPISSDQRPSLFFANGKNMLVSCGCIEIEEVKYCVGDFLSEGERIVAILSETIVLHSFPTSFWGSLFGTEEILYRTY